MYYKMTVYSSNAVARDESSIKFLPDLLRKNLEVFDFFGGQVRIEVACRPGGNSLDLAVSGEKLVLVAGHVRLFGQDAFLTPEQVLTHFDGGTRRFGGQYSIIVVDMKTRRVDALTTLSRLIPTYWISESRGLSMSNRQSEISPRGPWSELDREAMVPFLGEGYYPHDRSAFHRVCVAPPDVRLTWELEQVSAGPVVVPLSDIQERVGAERPNEDTFDAVAEALRRAFLPVIPGLATRVGLTGGRDSRLIAACLHAADVEFSTFTRANTSDASRDVEVFAAEQVAKSLGVPHSAQVAKRDKAPASRHKVDLVARIASVTQNTDFSVFGYETLDASPKAFDVGAIAYNGGGGELLRQAYGNSAWQTKERARRRILRHAESDRWGIDGGWYSDWIEDWLLQNQHLPPGGLLNKFSLLYRTGRWGSGVYSATYGKVNQRPYYDNEVLSLVLPISTDWIATDVLYYECLRRLAPSLLRLPFSGHREWGLGRAPTQAHQGLMETLPGPLGEEHDNATSKLPWRQQIAGRLGKELLALIQRSADSFGLLEPTSLRRLEDAVMRVGKDEKNGALTKRLWASASAGVQLAMTTSRMEVFGGPCPATSDDQLR